MALEITLPSIEPSAAWEAVTPSDVTTYSDVRGVFVAGAGTLVLTDGGGAVVTFTCVAGQLLPVSPSKIKAASTATGIVVLK
jgi:hypothetical protein